MTELTLEELAELDRLSAAATSAPWCSHPNGTSVWSGRDYETSETADHLLNATSVTERACLNIDLVVETRNALPALLAMARELIRIRSAMAVCHASGHCGSSIMEPERVFEWATDLGWIDPSPPATPVAEMKGGEG